MGNLYMRCKTQCNLFALAVMFFTRIPLPFSVDYSDEKLHQSNRYFSLVGWLLASLLTLVYYLFEWLLNAGVFDPNSVQGTLEPDNLNGLYIILIMTFSVMLTGAFHEDGLADMADGVGGGMTIEKRLTIMKDSRIGTYGTVSLIFVLLLKWQVLTLLLNNELLIASLFLAYGLSRAVAASLIFDMPYVADIDASKSKPMAHKQNTKDLTFLFIIGAFPFCFFSMYTFFICCVVLWVFRFLIKKWLMLRLGGYTGDCLGAVQQISELLIYLVILSTYTRYTL